MEADAPQPKTEDEMRSDLEEVVPFFPIPPEPKWEEYQYMACGGFPRIIDTPEGLVMLEFNMYLSPLGKGHEKSHYVARVNSTGETYMSSEVSQRPYIRDHMVFDEFVAFDIHRAIMDDQELTLVKTGNNTYCLTHPGAIPQLPKMEILFSK